MISLLGVGATPSLPEDFGDGWMTRSAIDLCRIAVGLGGFDAASLARRLAFVKGRGRRINAASVETVLAAMYQEREG